MLTAGDLIDNTLGVQFGLATLTAAAGGQVVRLRRLDACEEGRGRTPGSALATLAIPSRRGAGGSALARSEVIPLLDVSRRTVRE